MISETKRKQLEAAGYSISKSGKTVTNGEGTVAGINSNGKVFGSGKAFDILKGSNSSAPTESKKPKARSTSTKSPSSSSSAPKESKRPKQRQMGRGEPNYGEPKASPMGPSTRQSNKPKNTKETPTRDRREGTTLLRSNNKPTLREFVLERVRASGDYSAEAQRKYRNEYKEKYGEGKNTQGMNKGGVVRTGNTDYKKTGMFYKSGSPRGYK